MTGQLVKLNDEWVVRYDKGHEAIHYSLCDDSKKWYEKNKTKPFINDGMEVIFDLITSGRFSKSQEMMVKEFSARIQYVEPQL